MQIRTCLKYEYKKAMLLHGGLWVILLCLAANFLILFFSRPQLWEYTFDRAVYKEYIAKYGGTYSDETAEAMRAESAELLTAASSAEDAQAQSAEEYIMRADERLIAQHRLEALSAALKRYEELAEIPGAALIYDLELAEYLQSDTALLFAIACMAFFTVTVYFFDLSCGMHRLLYTAKAGRKHVLQSKRICILLTAAVIFAFFAMTGFFAAWMHRDFGDLRAPLNSVQGFSACKLQISVRGGLWLSLLLKALSGLLAASLLLLCCALLKNEIAAFSAFGLMFAAGYYLAENSLLNPVTYLRGTAALSAMTPGKLGAAVSGTVLLSAVMLCAVRRFEARRDTP